MGSKSTIVIRAPKNIMKQVRMNFPSLKDSEIIKVMYDSSLFKIENNLRRNVKKK